MLLLLPTDNFPGLDGVVGTHAQFVDMMADGQGKGGEISSITPTVWQLGNMYNQDPNWGSAFPTLAHRVWMTSGKTDIIEKHLNR